MSAPDPRRLVETINRGVRRGERRSALVIAGHIPRRAEFSLANIAVGTQEEIVSWVVPIDGDYAVVVAPTSAAAFVGLLAATVKAGTKTATGCTVIVANRAASPVGLATFDVLAFPL
jgi:hypothetical protein